MNFGELKRLTRAAAQDTSTYSNLWSDEEIESFLNEAQVEACRNSKLLYTTSPTVGETRARCEITVFGMSGTISSILTDNINIITNPVAYTSNDNTTAALLSNEINNTGLFEATVVGNIITLIAPEGSGSSYNNVTPIIVSTNSFTTVTSLNGGVDGICVIHYKPNKKEYKFSSKLLKIEAAYRGDEQKRLYFRDFRDLNDSDKMLCNQKGDVEVVLYGMSLDSVYLGKVPAKKGYVSLSAYHLPLRTMKANSDIPEIKEEYHSKLIHYALYKMYQKNDIEGGQLEISEFHYNKFKEEFSDNQFAAASNKTTNLLFFFGG